MNREVQVRFKYIVASALLVGMSAFAQLADDPDNNIQGTTPGQVVGEVLGTFVPALGGDAPLGLEAYDGGIWGTDVSNDAIGFMDLNGNLQNGFTGIGNPTGVTTDGRSLYITDTAGDDVNVHSFTGKLLSTFSVASETGFPEGITYNFDSNTLLVVDGSSGGNKVAEYTIDGVLQGTFPIAGSSPDGIAYDNAGSYYLYDSGTDTVRLYDDSFTQVQAFSGPLAAGFSTGEGVAYADNVVYVCATGSEIVVAFDAGRIEVPTLSEMGLLAMISVMLLGSLAVMRRS